MDRDFEDAFAAVQTGRARLAMIPIENSTAGRVADAHHLMPHAGLHIIGEAKHKTGVVSFTIDGMHPFDIGTLLDKQGIAVRTGHHCTQPLLDFYQIPGTVRASFAFYNTKAEIDTFLKAFTATLKTQTVA